MGAAQHVNHLESMSLVDVADDGRAEAQRGALGI